MQSHIWDHIVATIVKQKLFFIHLRLSLFYLSLSFLHFFLLSSPSMLCRCVSPMSVLCRWLCSANGRGSWSEVPWRFSGSRFMGLSSRVWVHGSRIVGLRSWIIDMTRVEIRVVHFGWGWNQGGAFWLGLRMRWVGGDWGGLLWLRRG